MENGESAAVSTDQQSEIMDGGIEQVTTSVEEVQTTKTVEQSAADDDIADRK